MIVEIVVVAVVYQPLLSRFRKGENHDACRLTLYDLCEANNGHKHSVPKAMNIGCPKRSKGKRILVNNEIPYVL